MADETIASKRWVLHLREHVEVLRRLLRCNERIFLKEQPSVARPRLIKLSPSYMYEGKS